MRGGARDEIGNCRTTKSLNERSQHLRAYAPFRQHIFSILEIGLPFHDILFELVHQPVIIHLHLVMTLQLVNGIHEILIGVLDRVDFGMSSMMLDFMNEFRNSHTS